MRKKPETAILRKAFLQVWLLAGVWELEFQERPHLSLTDQGGPLCLACLCKLYSLC